MKPGTSLKCWQHKKIFLTEAAFFILPLHKRLLADQQKITLLTAP
jgi:hypothetical protein